MSELAYITKKLRAGHVVCIGYKGQASYERVIHALRGIHAIHDVVPRYNYRTQVIVCKIYSTGIGIIGCINKSHSFLIGTTTYLPSVRRK